MVLKRKALYGICSSSEIWHAHFLNIPRGIGFQPTGFYSYVRIKLPYEKSHYQYLCTNVDDFMILKKIRSDYATDKECVDSKIGSTT